MRGLAVSLSTLLLIAATGCGGQEQTLVANRADVSHSDGKMATPLASPSDEFQTDGRPADSAGDADQNLEELSIEELVLGEISGPWVGEDGTKYSLTKSARQEMLRRLVPAAQKQDRFVYDAQVTKIAEQLSGSKTVRTETTNEAGTVVTLTHLPSDGERRLAEARQNIKKTAADLGDRLNGLGLVANDDGARQKTAFTNNCESTVRKLLVQIYKRAVWQAVRVMPPPNKASVVDGQ